MFSALKASQSMHKALLRNVVRSPMAFFDTTPIGRIINRFTKDIDVCDNNLGGGIRGWISQIGSFIGSIILIITVIPYFIFVILPIMCLFYLVQKAYVRTSRQLKRLVAVTISPLYSHVGETLNGMSTIRAFGLQQKFTQELEGLVDENTSCAFPSMIAKVWLQVRLEIIGSFVIFAAAILAIILKDSMNSSVVGLIITKASEITAILSILIQTQSELETNFVAVERIKEYSELENEAEWSSDNPPLQTWPEIGDIEFKNYGMRYRKGLDLVLKGIDAYIKGGEKIGIVGRTGAGKSSLTTALFRVVEPATGSICIDNLDVSTLGLHDLRRRLTIIPQGDLIIDFKLGMSSNEKTPHFNFRSCFILWHFEKQFRSFQSSFR